MARLPPERVHYSVLRQRAERLRAMAARAEQLAAAMQAAEVHRVPFDLDRTIEKAIEGMSRWLDNGQKQLETFTGQTVEAILADADKKHTNRTNRKAAPTT